MSLEDRVFVDTPGGQRRGVGLSLVTPVCDICGAVLADQKRHDEWHGDGEYPDEPVEVVKEAFDKGVKGVTVTRSDPFTQPDEKPLPLMFGKAIGFMEGVRLRGEDEEWPDSTLGEINNVIRVLRFQMPVMELSELGKPVVDIKAPPLMGDKDA